MNIKFMKIFILSFFFSFLSISVLMTSAGAENLTLSSFSTSTAHQSDDVKHNIALACRSLNGAVIPEGAVFSFNDTVGEASASRGYSNGAVLYSDSLVMEPGGGLCQVSSTLFNALLLAGCSITERHRHYQPVTYTPLGLDATIKYGKKDLKMKNTTGQNLTIRTLVSDSSLTIIIYGAVKPSVTYALDTEENEIQLPFADEQNIRPGMEIYVYRIKQSGTETERFLLYKDFYPPVKIQ